METPFGYIFLIMCTRREKMKMELMEYWNITENDVEFYISLIDCHSCAMELTGFWRCRASVIFTEYWLHLKVNEKKIVSDFL